MTGARQSIRLGIYGASGSGKTTKALELLRPVRRVVVFDPMDEWGEHRYARTTAKTFRRALVDRWKTGFRIAVVPTYGREAETLHFVSQTIRDAQVATGSAAPITLMVDELNTSFPVTSLPSNLLGFGELCSRGRHFRISIVGVTQRIAEVNTRWRGNTSANFIFRQASNPDVKAAEALLPPGHRGRVASLPNFEYLYVEQGRVTRGKVRRR